jgi:hypothetical protein
VIIIAWRVGHFIVGVLGSRASNHFGVDGIDCETFGYVARSSAAWVNGTRCTARGSRACADSVTQGLARHADPLKGRSRAVADHTMAELVLYQL